MKAFKKQSETLSKLMAVSSNRLSIAPALFSKELITFECYRNTVKGSSKTEEEKCTALTISLMSTISTQPQLMNELINIFKRIEPFQQVAINFTQDCYQ